MTQKNLIKKEAKLKEIEKEMVKVFNQWEKKIKARQQVTIQDLDYWECVLREHLMECE